MVIVGGGFAGLDAARGLKSKRVQCDEIWSFVGAKAKNVTPEQKAAGWGDAWTWTALDPEHRTLIDVDDPADVDR